MEKPPVTDYLAWVTRQPDAMRDYLLAVYALSRLEVQIIQNGVVSKGVVRLTGDTAVLQVHLS